MGLTYSCEPFTCREFILIGGQTESHGLKHRRIQHLVEDLKMGRTPCQRCWHLWEQRIAPTNRQQTSRDHSPMGAIRINWAVMDFQYLYVRTQSHQHNDPTHVRPRGDNPSMMCLTSDLQNYLLTRASVSLIVVKCMGSHQNQAAQDPCVERGR